MTLCLIVRPNHFCEKGQMESVLGCQGLPFSALGRGREGRKPEY